jgi:hypothetical protein
MSRASPAALTRLRHHRGLWWLLAFALIVKLAASTVCLTDGFSGRTLGSSSMPTMVELSLDTGTSSISDDGDTCVLGEPGGCHCACAHTATLPTTIAIDLPRIDARFSAPAIVPDFAPAAMTSLLRPPIA